MMSSHSQCYLSFKRLLDISFSLVLLLVLWPIWVLIVVAILVESPGPVFFRQKRVGRNKRHFQILKFRTMLADTPKDTPTHLLDNPKKWVTRVGRLLRKTSLDELPQLINILKGEMSFVGPRPALWNQFDLIAERDKYGANEIPVGLTGWAQINGRDELLIPEKAKMDGYYANNLSLLMDVKCVIGTFLAVFRADGVVEGGTGATHKEHEN